MVAIACYLYISNWWRLLSTELEEASRDSFVVQDLDVDTLRLMLDYLYLGNIGWSWILFFQLSKPFYGMESDYWLASSVLSRTNQHLGYLLDVIVAASGKIRDNVEALGAEQVYSLV